MFSGITAEITAPAEALKTADTDEHAFPNGVKVTLTGTLNHAAGHTTGYQGAPDWTANTSSHTNGYTAVVNNVSIKIAKASVGATFDFSVATAEVEAAAVADADYTSTNLKNLKNSNGGDLTSTALDGWNVDTGDLNALKGASVGTTQPVKATKAIAPMTLDDYDFSGLTVSHGKVVKTFNVKVVAKQGSTDADLNNESKRANLIANYTIGGDKVTLSGTNKAKYEIVTQPSNLDKKKVTDRFNVTIQTTKEYPESDYDISAILDTLNADNGVKGIQAGQAQKAWTYSGKKFVTEIPVAVVAKTLYSDDIVWPTKLANGETVAIGDIVSDLKLEETESSKYGTFKLVSKNGSAALSADTKYDIVFTANHDYVELDSYVVSGVIYVAKVTGPPVVPATYTKTDGFAVSVAKNTIKSSDLKVTMKAGYDDELSYGTTYAQYIQNANLPKSDIGNWTLKDAKDKVVAGVIPMGTTDLKWVYTVKNKDVYLVDGSKETLEIPVTVTVKAPVLKPEINRAASDQTVQVKTNPGTITASLGFDKFNIATAPIAWNEAGLKVRYQWYSTSKGALYGANGFVTAGPANLTDVTLNIDDSTVGSDTYYCVYSLTVDEKTCVHKDEWNAIIKANKFETDKITVTVSNLAYSNIAINGKKEYSDITAVASFDVNTTGTDYTIATVNWEVKDADGKATAVEGKSTYTGHYEAAVPTTLDVGKYTMVATVTASSKSGLAADVTVIEVPVEITKSHLALSKFDATKITLADKKVKYGHNVTEVQFTGAKDFEKYGTYEWVERIVDSTFTGSATMRFYPNDATKKNYDNWDVTKYEEFAVSLEVVKGEITIKADDVTLTVGDALPSTTAITYKVDGLVDGDSLKSLDVALEYAFVTSKIDTAKAGTYADTVVITATKDKRVNEKIDLANYEVKVVPGSVIVKAKADVAPSVKPTPAPVKQATAAAPKAAKAKATVKVGKKYTLKLKYAAGKKATVKKVTWKSSKKSVATVSSKGKVTAVKAGKATIAATITFKDGSKKKVKFTVTVK